MCGYSPGHPQFLSYLVLFFPSFRGLPPSLLGVRVPAWPDLRPGLAPAWPQPWDRKSKKIYAHGETRPPLHFDRYCKTFLKLFFFVIHVVHFVQRIGRAAYVSTLVESIMNLSASFCGKVNERNYNFFRLFPPL